MSFVLQGFYPIIIKENANFARRGLTVCVTRAGAGGGTPSDWKNAEA